jgi:hypothetical protein
MPLTYAVTDIGSKDGSAKLATWTGLSENDTDPAAVSFPEHADRSVQVTGTFNGGTVVLEGSNDGANWFTLNDPQGNALSFTTAKIEQVLEACCFMRPKRSAGTGLNINVHMMMRRTSGMRT